MWRRSDRWTACGSALVYVGLGVVSRGRPPTSELRLFQGANHGESELRLLWLPQQLGTPWVLPLLGVVGYVTHRPHLAVGGALALPLEKGLEVAVKKTLGRERPAKVDPSVELRDDAPTDGPSYPSGHAAIAFASVLLAALYLPAALNRLGLVNACLASWVRIRQGAHFPVDALGGAALGVLVSSTLSAVLGRPAGTPR